MLPRHSLDAGAPRILVPGPAVANAYSNASRGPANEGAGNSENIGDVGDGDAAGPTQIPDSLDKWSACSKMMEKFDQTMVQGWKEDIDTSLVFAGLFSAVLTGFVLESYTYLQPDQGTQTVQLLKFIAIQLTDPQAQTQNITAITDATLPPSSAKRINILWFTALVCSLVVALLGILAKQWLREYLLLPPASAREAIRLRQFRHEGLVRWRVEEIMAALPVLLELSLVLFLIGLLDFLWMLDWSVAAVITVLVGVSLAVYFGTTVLPAFSARNPFKSPQAWALCRLFWKLIPPRDHQAFFMALQEETSTQRYMPGSWTQREVASVRESGEGLDYRALVWVCKQATDDGFLKLVAPCVSDFKAREGAWLTLEVIARQGECTALTLLSSLRCASPSAYLEKLVRRVSTSGKRRLLHMILELLPRIDRQSADDSRVMVTDILQVLRRLLSDGEGAVCELADHRDALDSLTLLLDGHVYRHAQNETLHLLADMTQRGCNIGYCPEGIINVVHCADLALERRDTATIAHTCTILMVRLRGHGRSHQGTLRMEEALQDLASRLRGYFSECNQSRRLYGEGLRISWCSGISAIIKWCEAGDSHDLIAAFNIGVSLGLVHPEYEEAEIWDTLYHQFVSATDGSSPRNALVTREHNACHA